MPRQIISVTAATVLLALSAFAQASTNPSAAQDLVYTLSEKPFVAVTIGETIQVAKAEKTKEEKSSKTKTQAQKAKGYEKSGNPKAAGGLQNPGKGNAQKPSNVRPEQPIEKPKPEQPIAAPQPEPRDKEGTG